MTDTRFHGVRTWPVPLEDRSSWNNRYFLDTEFTDFVRCQLLSIAFVGEHGCEFYGERNDYDAALCSDFVREVVLPQLGRFEGRAMSFSQLRDALLLWLSGIPALSEPVLCYDYDTDLNLLRLLLGGPLPRGWALQSVAGRCDPQRRASYFARHGGEHHALHDARANAYAFVG